MSIKNIRPFNAILPKPGVLRRVAKPKCMSKACGAYIGGRRAHRRPPRPARQVCCIVARRRVPLAGARMYKSAVEYNRHRAHSATSNVAAPGVVIKGLYLGALPLTEIENLVYLGDRKAALGGRRES